MRFSKEWIHRDGATITFLVIFILTSCWVALPRKANVKLGCRSSELIQRIVSEGDKYRAEYVDKEGKITFAADLGYAIITREKTEDGILELIMMRMKTRCHLDRITIIISLEDTI